MSHHPKARTLHESQRVAPCGSSFPHVRNTKMKYAVCSRDGCISRCLGSDSCEVGSARVGQWIVVLDHSSCLRRRFDWGEPCLTGRSNDECYVPAERVGCLLTCRSRIHEEMFWGAIGCKRTIAIEPEKEPQSIDSATRVIKRPLGPDGRHLTSARARQRGSPEPFDENHLEKSQVRL